MHKIIFKKLYLKLFWCPRIQNSSLGNKDFLPLNMFLLFLQVIKNMIIFQKDAKICSTIWHKIYNSKQFFFSNKAQNIFFTCEKKEFHLHE